MTINLTKIFSVWVILIAQCVLYHFIIWSYVLSLFPSENISLVQFYFINHVIMLFCCIKMCIRLCFCWKVFFFCIVWLMHSKYLKLFWCFVTLSWCHLILITLYIGSIISVSLRMRKLNHNEVNSLSSYSQYVVQSGFEFRKFVYKARSFNKYAILPHYQQ